MSDSAKRLAFLPASVFAASVLVDWDFVRESEGCNPDSPLADSVVVEILVVADSPVENLVAGKAASKGFG